MRNLTSVTALAVAGILMTTSIAWAGSDGRRNTALAATALAVGAWSNHTGRAGRKNTAILATAGAAVAWGRYSSKKRHENRRGRCARLASRAVPVAWVPGRTVCRPRYRTETVYRTVYVNERHDHGRHLGWYKHHDQGDEDGDHEHHGHHHDRDD